MGRLLIAALTICLVGVALAGCGGRSDATPVACLEGASAYLDALGAAPGEVKLNGRRADQRLPGREPEGENSQPSPRRWGPRRPSSTPRPEPSPAGALNLKLGYLIGAAQKGAEGPEKESTRS